MLLRVTVGLILLVLVALVATITWLKSDSGREWLRDLAQREVSAVLDGDLTIERVARVSLAGVRVEGVRLLDPQGRVAVEIAAVEAEVAWWPLLSRVVRLPAVRLDAPIVWFESTPSGGIGLLEAVRLTPTESSRPSDSDDWRVELPSIHLASGQVRGDLVAQTGWLALDLTSTISPPAAGGPSTAAPRHRFRSMHWSSTSGSRSHDWFPASPG